MNQNYIDLRSDTVTLPSDIMREAMKNAVVGDDVYGEDPTVIALQQRVSKMFQKEEALFFPSGTMSNLCSILSWCPNRGSEIIVGNKSHIFLFEQAGACQFGGVSMRTVENMEDGTMNIHSIEKAIRDHDIHEPITKLICIENTHNCCGGKILPESFLKELRKLSQKHSIPIHMDGARIWNAMAACGHSPSYFSDFVDSFTVCLSKGLGAPIGSLLVGSNELINRAKRLRKALGGGMRQAGILAAAGMVALDDFEKGILIKDHDKAMIFVNGIKDLQGFKIHSQVHTNIVFLDIVSHDKKEDISSTICTMLKEKGVLVSLWAPLLLRIVIHRDISEEDIEKAVDVFKEVSHLVMESKKE